MSLLRIWRTVRHLTAEQWLYRAICRGRRVVMNAAPGMTRRRIERAAARLPLPDPSSENLRAVAQPVLLLQSAVHGGGRTDPRDGRFELLNQNFDFGSIERISWRGEFNEGNNPLRRMNLAYMGYLVPLMASGDFDAPDVAIRLIDSLEDQNHWSEKGVFRDVWNAYTASHRMINLLSGLALFLEKGGAINAEKQEKILSHARLCAAFIAANLERDLQYNHLLKNYVALATYCAGLKTPPAEFSFLPRAVEKSLRQNILPDGGHAERCPMYHALGMLDLDILAASGTFHGDVADDVSRTRKKMVAALPVMSHPDGDIALFNDSWFGEAPRAAALYPEPAPQSALLADSGYGRIGHGGDAVLMDCGPCGPDDNPGHAHADFLSIEASVGGARLIVDPGVPTYTAGELRDVSRSAARHNGPHLAGLEPIEFWKSFRVGRRGYGWPLTDEWLGGVAPLWLAGAQDGYAPAGSAVKRWVGLWPGHGFLVCDLWHGGEAHDAASHFLIPGEWSMTQTRVGPRFKLGEVSVSLSPLAGSVEAVEESEHWPRFGVGLSAHRVVCRPIAGRERRHLALWFSWSDMAPPEADNISGLFAALADC